MSIFCVSGLGLWWFSGLRFRVLGLRVVLQGWILATESGSRDFGSTFGVPWMLEG